MPTPQVIKNALFELTLKIAPDRLKLFIDAKPCEIPAEVKRKDLLLALQGHVNAELLELGVLDDIAEKLSQGSPISERRIAKGRAAVQGIDGRLALLVKPFTGKGAPRDTAQGTIDFRSLHLFDNIVTGAVIGKLFAPTLGTEGIDVTGNKIPATAGKPAKIATDKSISQSRVAKEELECLVANTHGYLFDDSGRLVVRGELRLPADIDLRTGSIDFIGSLIVTGDVAPGFFAKANQGVTIGGAIRDAIIESSAGDIVIKGFSFGGPGSARVVATGAITLSSAQELAAEARADITVQKNCTDCTLRTHRGLFAAQASVVGGEIFAVCGGEIGELGNDAGKHTVFHLCNNVQADPAFSALLAKISTHQKAIGMLEGHLGPYAKNGGRIQLLKSPFREKMQELSRKLQAIQKSLVELERNKALLLAGAIQNEVQRVNILKIAHSGVEILCDGESFVLQDSLQGPISIDFDPKTKKFSVGPLQALACTVDKSAGVKK